MLPDYKIKKRLCETDNFDRMRHTMIIVRKEAHTAPIVKGYVVKPSDMHLSFSTIPYTLKHHTVIHIHYN